MYLLLSPHDLERLESTLFVALSSFLYLQTFVLPKNPEHLGKLQIYSNLSKKYQNRTPIGNNRSYIFQLT
jgi:hypothetical protein